MDDVGEYKILNSIVIPVFGNEDLLNNLLITLLSTIDAQCEVIVIDDGLEYMKLNPNNLPKKIRYFSNHENKGYSYSVNRGIKEARGDYISTINSDILLDKNWLMETRKVFENFNNVGLVGARLIYPSNGRIQSSGKKHNGNVIISMFRMRKPSELSNDVYEVSTISDALATMPKSVVEEAGFYDEYFFNSYDDLDLCMRIRKKGYRILCNPLIIGYHHTSASCEFRYICNDQSSKLFTNRWKETLNEDLLSYYQSSLLEFISRGNALPLDAFVVTIFRKAHPDFVKIFKELSSVHVLQEYDYSDHLKNIPLHEQKVDIDLLRVLPFSLLLVNHPIIYIVDSFIQLKDNHYWGIKRNNQSDLVFDSNFNIYMFNEILEGI